MLPSFASDSITIEEPVWVSDRGKEVATYPGTSIAAVDGCSVQPGNAVESLTLRDNVVIRYTAFVPSGTQVSRHAKIIYMGTEFAIEGIPLVWRSPLGTVDHIVLLLIDWEG